jgi:polyhydroxyalkanoate synthesis repressor PhaR
LPHSNTPGGLVLVKKYANRRLYDTEQSRYITQEELAAKIAAGADARVIDAKTGEDLTQATLVQLIMESRGAARLLPVGLLTQLIRMGDDALGEFFGRFLSACLELYQQVRTGAQTVSPFNPFPNMPFAAANALARLFSGSGWREPTPPPAPAPAIAPPMRDDVADLRRELEELKRSMRRKKK